MKKAHRVAPRALSRAAVQRVHGVLAGGSLHDARFGGGVCGLPSDARVILAGRSRCAGHVRALAGRGLRRALPTCSQAGERRGGLPARRGLAAGCRTRASIAQPAVERIGCWPVRRPLRAGGEGGEGLNARQGTGRASMDALSFDGSLEGFAGVSPPRCRDAAARRRRPRSPARRAVCRESSGFRRSRRARPERGASRSHTGGSRGVVRLRADSRRAGRPGGRLLPSSRCPRAFPHAGAEGSF